jgi:hypothetical protein
MTPSVLICCVLQNQCKPNQPDAGGSSIQDASPIGNLPSIGPVIDQAIAAKTTGSSKEMIADYSNAVEGFQQSYGPKQDPYQIVLLRSIRFISRTTWDKVKTTTNYNPITATDKVQL